MLFFLNDGIQENKSGIEHAQMKRLQLFKQFKQPAKIVTRQYSNELHLVTKHAGIADEDFVNLFDYFQNARIVPPKDVTIRDIQIDPHWRRQADGITTPIRKTATGSCMCGGAMMPRSASSTCSTSITSVSS